MSVLWQHPRRWPGFPSVSVVQQGTKQTNMVNKREKNEGAKKVATTTAPKTRVPAKPKAASRIPGTVKTEKAAKPAKKKIATPLAFTQDDIAFRAYLIAEKRQQLGLPGDSLGDWVEAERQLRGERGTHGVN
jgi:hypothetical protein